MYQTECRRAPVVEASRLFDGGLSRARMTVSPLRELRSQSVSIPYNQRTCYCGQAGPHQAGQTVILTGWVQSYRDHGGMVFIDLRDRTGLVQIKFNPETDPLAHQTAGKLRAEFCVAVRGDVALRPEGLRIQISPRARSRSTAAKSTC